MYSDICQKELDLKYKNIVISIYLGPWGTHLLK